MSSRPCRRLTVSRRGGVGHEKGLGMPIVLGVGVSYSPLMYRPRSQWPGISHYLVGEVTQPQSREREVAEVLATYERRIAASFEATCSVIQAGRLDALIVLCADRADVFDESNVPQLHVQVGGEVFGDPAIHELGEPSRALRFACDDPVADLLGEELVRVGFDVSEGRAAFKPLGKTGRGLGSAAAESVARFAGGIPIVPIHVNCHVEPTLSGERLHTFGRALAKAAALCDQRVGVLVSGGLSGDPRGPMAGWIDDVLDQWVLSRLVRGQSEQMAQIWAARSRTLQGNSAEIRLWMVAAAALEQANCRARVIDYMPVHHAATGIGFVAWEQPSCR